MAGACEHARGMVFAFRCALGEALRFLSTLDSVLRLALYLSAGWLGHVLSPLSLARYVWALNAIALPRFGVWRFMRQNGVARRVLWFARRARALLQICKAGLRCVWYSQRRHRVPGLHADGGPTLSAHLMGRVRGFRAGSCMLGWGRPYILSSAWEFHVLRASYHAPYGVYLRGGPCAPEAAGRAPARVGGCASYAKRFRLYARSGHAPFCWGAQRRVPGMCAVRAGNVRRWRVRHGVGHLVEECTRFCRPAPRAGLAACILFELCVGVPRIMAVGFPLWVMSFVVFSCAQYCQWVACGHVL